jgi:hypothetical protein
MEYYSLCRRCSIYCANLEFMIAIIFAYLLFCILLAKDNADRIAKDLKIRHWLNATFHLTMAGILCLVDWKLAVALLFLVKVVFDSSLNLFRGKTIDYISPEVRKLTGLWQALMKGKFVDYIEYKLFGENGYTPKIVYITIAVCLLAV